MNSSPSTSDDEQGLRIPSPARTPAENRRTINPNFLFFCQIVLLIVPIAVLYAGLYFMNISSPIIVAICGVIIFVFLCVVIFIRPFSPPQNKEGEDTVPLTRTTPPSGKYQYRTGTERLDEPNLFQSVPNKYHRSPNRTQQTPNNKKYQVREPVDEEEFVDCVCSSNPSPHFQGTTNRFPCSNTHITTIESKENAMTASGATEEDAVLNCSHKHPKPNYAWNKIKTCPLEKEAELSQMTELEWQKKPWHDEVELDLLSIDLNDDVRHVHFKSLSAIEEEEFLFRRPEYLKSNETDSQETCSDPACQYVPTSLQKKSTRGRTKFPTKRGYVVSYDDSLGHPTSIAGHQRLDDFDMVPSSKIPKLVDDRTCSSSAKHCTIPLRYDLHENQNDKETKGVKTHKESKISYTPCTNRNNDRKPILIKLFPTSSKVGTFEWGNFGGIGNNSHNIFSYNYKPSNPASNSKITVEDSSQTVIPSSASFKQGSEHETKPSLKSDMVAELEVISKAPTTKPKSILYIVNEKSRSPESIPKIKKGEGSVCESLCRPEELVKSSDIKTETREENDETFRHSSECSRNDSILDFVLKGPFYNRSSGSKKEDSNSNFNTPLSLSGTVMEMSETRDCIEINSPEKPSPSVVTGSTRREKTHLEPIVLKADNVTSKTNCGEVNTTEKDQKTCAKMLLIESKSDLYPLNLCSNFFGGVKDLLYQPSKPGLLATESSKEEVLARVQRKTRSPRTKKKTKTRPSLRDDLTKTVVSRWEDCVGSLPQTMDRNKLLNSSQQGKMNTVRDLYAEKPFLKTTSPKSSKLLNSGRDASVKERRQKNELEDVQHRRTSFPPFNLDFSSGGHEESKKPHSAFRKTKDEELFLNRKGLPEGDGDKINRRAKDDSALSADEIIDKGGSGSPGKTKSRRISHRVESTLFKKSSSSYDNVIIERVIRQKKKTLKKFK